MPRPHPIPNDPDPDRDGCWSSRDQEQPGVSIRPLSQTDLQALLAHLTYPDPDQDQQPGQDLGEGFRPVRSPAADGPVVAVRVRASIGRPGASAQAQYRRRRTAELAAWTHGLPWRAAAILVGGLTGGLLGTLVAPRLAGLLGLAAAAAVGWPLRFRVSADTRAWRRGARGEQRTARLLAPLERRGWAVLHDLAIPGSPANIDHLVIGPGGVVVIDTKQYRGRLQLDRDGMLWHGCHLLVSTLRRTRWEADQADELVGIADVEVIAIVAIHGARVPWGLLRAEGVTVVPARRLPDLLCALPPILGPEWVAWLADRARRRFHPAA